MTPEEWRSGSLNGYWRVFREGYLAAVRGGGDAPLEDHEAWTARVMAGPAALGYELIAARDGPVLVRPSDFTSPASPAQQPGLKVIAGGKD